MTFFKSILIFVLTITLPISQAYAVVPDSHSTLSDAVESHGENSEMNISTDEIADSTQIPTGDLFQVQTIISSHAADEVIEIHDDSDDLLPEPIADVDDQRFWTSKKIVISSSILLTAGLLVGLLLLLAGGGSGGGSSAGTVGGSSGAVAGAGIPGIVPGVNGGVAGGDLVNIIPFGVLEGPDPGLDSTNPLSLPVGQVPPNPEPSTFLLMGLGLLVPFLRKRFSL